MVKSTAKEESFIEDLKILMDRYHVTLERYETYSEDEAATEFRFEGDDFCVRISRICGE